VRSAAIGVITEHALSQQTTIPRHAIGQVLMRAGRINDKQLEVALAQQKKTGSKLGQILVEMGAVTEADIHEVLRKQEQRLWIKLTPAIVDRTEAARLDAAISRRVEAVVVNRIADILTVAMADPGDLDKVDEVARALRARILAVAADSAEISTTIEVICGKPETANQKSLEHIATTLDQRDDLFAQLENARTDEESDPTLDAPVVNMMRGIFRDAVDQRASDIHLETTEKEFVVRFRVDGNMFERLRMGKQWSRPSLARLKILSGLDIAQNRLPQDGRAQAKINGVAIDFRVATTPVLHGESAVVRILDGGRIVPQLSAMGLDEYQRTTIESMVQCREGLILATGPTGSGKTTTLYAILSTLNDSRRKIITLEDPVENQMVGISQINVNVKVGLTFATGLRSILRQDPDIVLVGEIRDEETAHTAVNAALTGHIVLSTLHTLGTVETIARLVEMGVPRYLLTDTIRGIVAQRLVKTICGNCKVKVNVTPAVLRQLGLPETGQDYYHGKGCEACHGTGERGRKAVLEILKFTLPVREMIHRGERAEDIRSAAIAGGMQSLKQDLARHVLAGTVSATEAVSLILTD
jgi:type IV pilus assembly protein PilB